MILRLSVLGVCMGSKLALAKTPQLAAETPRAASCSKSLFMQSQEAPQQAICTKLSTWSMLFEAMRYVPKTAALALSH